MQKTMYIRQPSYLTGDSSTDNRFEYLNNVVSVYIDQHQYMCQEADRQDLKQEVLMRLCKLMPDQFESDKHFQNWCRRFSKLYSINAFRDFCLAKKKRKELLVEDYNEQIVEQHSCQEYISQINLYDHCNRKYKLLKREGIDSIEIAQILTESHSPVTDMSKKLDISKRRASSLLKRQGFRTKRLNTL